ncbi:MAG: DNA replication complex subunit Gins51 [Promethearchaeota archaeon]
MDLKSNYDLLYQHWLNEFEDIELTILTQDIFNKYKNCLQVLNNLKGIQGDIIKNEIIKTYQDNYKYLFYDLLKMRKIKIINAALAQKEIDLSKTIEPETLFYQNIISSIKGFEKMKALSIFEGEIDEYIQKIVDSEKEEKIFNGDSEIVPLEDKISEKNAVQKDIQYVILRFLKETPPLVGIDLLNYGPFEKEDIASIPYKNAKILLTEKFAEIVNNS